MRRRIVIEFDATSEELAFEVHTMLAAFIVDWMDIHEDLNMSLRLDPAESDKLQ